METRREDLWKLLGIQPQKGNFETKIISVEKINNFYRTLLKVQLVESEWVEVQITQPLEGNKTQKLVICMHSHGGNYSLGKNEILLGNHYLQSPSFATELSELEYMTISIDARGFGTRQIASESELVKESLIYGSTLWGKMLTDYSYLIDWLESIRFITYKQLGVLGMSMGGLMAWWLTSLDDRINWVVDIAAQVDLEALVKAKSLNKHGHYYYVPGILREFSTAEIQSWIAPRPRLSLVGVDDGNCPNDGVVKLRNHLEIIYSNLQQLDAWNCPTVHGKHEETPQMRNYWKKFVLQQGV